MEEYSPAKFETKPIQRIKCLNENTYTISMKGTDIKKHPIKSIELAVLAYIINDTPYFMFELLQKQGNAYSPKYLLNYQFWLWFIPKGGHHELRVQFQAQTSRKGVPRNRKNAGWKTIPVRIARE